MKKVSLLVAALAAGTLASTAMAERIIVAGDSITGQSKLLGGKSGYYWQFNEALADAGVKDVELIPLGGSGQSINSWRNVIKNSYEKNAPLDIKEYMPKDELDKGCDTFVIFLGMNDTLAPYTNLEQLDAWKKNYQLLINDAKARVKFSKLVLASPTMCTENLDTYKNKIMAKMNEIVAELAKENNAVHAKTWDEFTRCWKLLRMDRPLAKMSGDYVHPGRQGHTAITVALLRAVGQEKAAEMWYEKNKKSFGKVAMGEPGMLLYVLNADKPGVITVKGEVGNMGAPALSVKLPEAWKQSRFEQDGTRFTLTIVADATELVNPISVTATADGKTATQTLNIYAPFLATSKVAGTRWFNDKEFDGEKQTAPADKAIMEKGDFTAAPRDAKGNKADWFIYYPTNDVVGGDDPNSVDFASFDDVKAFDQGYMVRYVFSEAGTKAKLKLVRRIFAGNIGATVFLNGAKIDSLAIPGGNAGKELDIELQAGWNMLAVRCSHVTWQFQLSAALEPATGKLLYSVTGK